MKSYRDGSLNIEVQSTRHALEIVWRGQSVARDPSASLNAFFSQINGPLTANRRVVLDFRNLEYMNSSTLKPIITLVTQLSEVASQVEVKCDSTKNWQRLSFKAIKALVAERKNVTIDA